MTRPDDCNGSYWECLACKGPPTPAPPRDLLATCTAMTLVGGCWVTPLIEPMVEI